MKKLLLACVSFSALFLLGGCAQQKDSTPPAGLLSNVCVMSGEPLEADSPTSAYNGGKVAFCCEKCQAKWAKLDDAGKKAAFTKNATPTK
jgi:hypothetical protein